MSYYTSLTGLNAASTELSVASNNIANVSTTGFKKSRAEFGDLVASSLYQVKGTPGLGTSLRGIDQEFTQGSFKTTDETLNMAISGQGFFVTRNGTTGGATTLTRDGAFAPDDQGYVTDQSGSYLQVLPVDSGGNPTASGLSSLTTLRVPQTNGSAKATSSLKETLTLPMDADLPASRSVYASGSAYAFDRNDPNSYNHATSTTVYDASGNALQATTYFVRTKAPTAGDPTSTWDTHVFVGDTEATGAGALTFDGTGALTSPTGSSAYTVSPSGSTGGLAIGIDYGTATKQAGSVFALTGVSQDGAELGKLSGLTVGTDGLVAASYSDGSVSNLGRVALANVTNPQGLKEAGDNKWIITSESGDATVTGANSGGAGTIKSGTLEVANVDVTEELVTLIQAQRNFQANAKAIDTANQISEIAVNLRS